uniref:Uncharacterized protein n=1 Tax=Anguilla anguilla TaxID=7936 RepID=A0A0E9R5Z3_ANGAN
MKVYRVKHRKFVSAQRCLYPSAKVSVSPLAFKDTANTFVSYKCPCSFFIALSKMSANCVMAMSVHCKKTFYEIAITEL